MRETVALMPRAAFSIESYIFDKVRIDLSKKISSRLSLSIEPSGEFHMETSLFNLKFVVRIFAEHRKTEFINVQCNSVFKFHSPITLETIPDYFYNNSIAILFPYIRAYISMVTTQANTDGIILPTLNLSSLGEELKNHTVQK